MENQLSDVNAREQLDLLLNFYDVDLASLDKDGTLKTLVEKTLIKAIMDGKVEVENTDTELVVRQNLRDGKQFLYHEVTGMAKVQMERFEGSHQRLYALLGCLSKKPPEQIQKFSGPDLKIAEYLGMIFLMG